MVDIEDIKNQVKRNCNISDSRAWGYYSICGLLMRMRELYRHEHGIGHWESIGNEALDWVSEREALWLEMVDRDYDPVKVGKESHAPFEVEKINSILNGEGYVYGAGYGLFSKPTFFLARLKEIKKVEGFTVYYADEEIARDISASPAMLQEKNIYIRHQPLQAILWDRFLQLKGRKFKGALGEAFASFGIDGSEEPSSDLFGKVVRVSHGIADILMRHELGEAVEDDDHDEWAEMLTGNTDKYMELYLRGIRDFVADTSEAGPIKWIVETRNRALLGFYVVMLDGIRKELFPEMLNAYQEFVSDGKWAALERVRMDGYERARNIMSEVVRAWHLTKSLDEVKEVIKEAVRGGEGKG